MAYQIKSSKFNPGSIARGARPSKRRIQSGVPLELNPETAAIDKLSTTLLANNLMPADMVIAKNTGEAGEFCLNALGITIEEVDASEPEKTFMRPSVLKEQASADKRAGATKKSTPEYTFTDVTDPFYIMDQSPPIHIQQERSRSIPNKDHRVLTSIAAAVGDINRIPNHLRLKQLAEK